MKINTTPGADPYANISELYDLEHQEFDQDVQLLVNFAQVVGDPILEMGCGSGRILLPIAEQGFRITGLDSSLPMLDRASLAAERSGLRDLVTLHRGDMRDADEAPGGPFGLVIFSLNGLMHLTTPQAQRDALASARKALDPRGQLLIDMMNPSIGQLQELANGPHLEGSWTLADGTIVDKWSHRKSGTDPQIIDTLLWYDHVAPDGAFSRVRSSFELRYVHPSELLLMLELSGFVEPMLYGSYDLDPFEPDSERLIVTAEVTSSGR